MLLANKSVPSTVHRILLRRSNARNSKTHGINAVLVYDSKTEQEDYLIPPKCPPNA